MAAHDSQRSPSDDFCAYARSVTERTVVRDPVSLPRPIAAIIVGAILAATLLALFWPSLPFNEGRRIVVGPTKVGVISRQIENDRAAGRTDAPAPDFEWVAPDGKRVSLGSLRPKAVVVNFWATWCEPCRKEMPLLDRTAAEEAGIVFLAVDLDEDGDKIRAFFDEVGVKRLEPLLDVGLATSRRYGLASVPSTFFIDGSGTIRHVQIGEMDEAKLRRGLDKVR
jgi:thiol-disulfide isomerase/thioredoxin